jgi:hypothetical protein
MLDGSKFKEGTTLSSTGSVPIRLPGDDVDAMTIFLNIIHLRMDQVPETVDRRTLFNLARLVDKYDCHRTVKPFSEKWAVKSRHSYYCLTEYIPVCWCFRQPDLFKTATKRAILKAEGDLHAPLLSTLPIPAAYFGTPTTSPLRNIN